MSATASDSFDETGYKGSLACPGASLNLGRSVPQLSDSLAAVRAAVSVTQRRSDIMQLHAGDPRSPGGAGRWAALRVRRYLPARLSSNAYSDNIHHLPECVNQLVQAARC